MFVTTGQQRGTSITSVAVAHGVMFGQIAVTATAYIIGAL
jgi:hypothetical protein